MTEIAAVYNNGIFRPLQRPTMVKEGAQVSIILSRSKPPLHPYIEPREETDEPYIAGTRIAVRIVVGYYRLGMNVDEIAQALPQLLLSQIFDALSYYHDHQEEIEEWLQANEPTTLAQKFGLQIQPDGRIEFSKAKNLYPSVSHSYNSPY